MGVPYQYLRGAIRPLDRTVSPGLIATQLAQGHGLSVDGTGRLWPEIVTAPPTPVLPHPSLFRSVTYDLVVMRPPAFPRLYIVDPAVDARSHPHLQHVYTGPHSDPDAMAHPEFFVDPSYPRDAICFFAPHDDEWRLDRDPIYRLVDMAASWVAAFLLTEHGGLATWPVPSAAHGEGAYREALPARPCPCLSGRSFERCHRPYHYSHRRQRRARELVRIGAI